MKVPWGRAMAVGAAALLMVVGSLFLVGSASAQPVETGSFSFSGDADDPITGGHSYSYDTGTGDEMTVVGDSDDQHSISAEIDGTDGYDWQFSISGPAGEALAPGTYAVTQGESTPGISLWRPNYFCWGIGSFTIDTIEWGPYGYLQALDASFEYHCFGGTPASRGQLHIRNSPAPPVLEASLNVAADGTFDRLTGRATVHGTVTCNKAAYTEINGTVAQTRGGVWLHADYFKPVDCTPGAPVAWTATATPPSETTFRKGHAKSTVNFFRNDADYDRSKTTQTRSTITLTKQ